ncbi:ferrochelatase [Bermanella sp. 47_1433_sub80_T6]|nr:ferrochelatase [Bermanella sp. 47_1433_sub80_T6]
MSQKTAIILVNLGTPDAPTKPAVRKFLKEFLWDDRIIKRNPVWWMILNGIVLNTRPKRVAKLYESIWQDDSPIRTIGYQQRDALQTQLKDKARVMLAMTYGQPSLKDCLASLEDKKIEKIIVLPLFPQYSSTTTAAVFDQVADFIKQTRNLPEIQLIKDYHQDDRYIEALANSIEKHWQKNGKSEKLLLSFHGIPQIYVDKGDPYAQQVKNTVNKLAQKLNLADSEYQLCFQSRFGPTQWLQPYTDKTLEQWAKSGVKSVDIICPAFSADCLETLEEISEENKLLFLNNGGEQYSYIPALNNDELHIEMMKQLVEPWLV